MTGPISFKALEQVPNSDPEIARFLQSLGKYPHMMMTAPEINFLEHDFLSKLSFVIGEESDLLKQSNWMIHLSRLLRRLLQDRNNHIEAARSQGLKGVSFAAIGSAIQVQASLADTECVIILQLIEQIPMMAQTLERIGRSYQDAGKPKRVIPSPALHDALKRLRTIAEPLVQAMPDRASPPNSP